MNILVKVSGDLVDNEEFYNWLSFLDSSLNNLFILCGGGTKITNVLKEHSISFKFGPRGREIESLEGKKLAKQVLEEQKLYVERKLKERRIKAIVFIPVIEVGGWIFHINGDELALALYPNFDKIFIVTIKTKAKSFPNLSKIKVVHF